MKNLIAKIIVITTLVLFKFAPLQAYAKAPATPYEHIPVDTFIAGFPSEAFIMLGIISYIVGVVYIFNAVLLKESVK